MEILNNNIKHRIIKEFETLKISKPEKFLRFILAKGFALSGSFMLYLIEDILHGTPDWTYDDIDIFTGNGADINVTQVEKNKVQFNVDFSKVTYKRYSFPKPDEKEELEQFDFTKEFVLIEGSQTGKLISRSIPDVQVGDESSDAWYFCIGGIASYTHVPSGKKFQFIVPNGECHNYTFIREFDISVCRNLYSFCNPFHKDKNYKPCLTVYALSDLLNREFTVSFKEAHKEDSEECKKTKESMDRKTWLRIEKYVNRGYKAIISPY